MIGIITTIYNRTIKVDPLSSWAISLSPALQSAACAPGESQESAAPRLLTVDVLVADPTVSCKDAAESPRENVVAWLQHVITIQLNMELNL